MSRSDPGTARLRRVIWSALFAMKLRLGLAAVSLLAVTLTELAAPWPLKIIFDHIFSDRPLSALLAPLNGLMFSRPDIALVVLSCSIAIIALANGSFSYVQIHTTSAIGHRLVYCLRRELFAHLTRLSLSFHTHAHSGELLTNVSYDTGVLREAFTEWALTFGANLLTLTAMLAVMFALNWQLSILILATLPLLFVVLFVLNRKITLTARMQRDQEGKVASLLSEVLGTMSLVQAFGRTGYEEDRFDTESAQSLETGIQTSRTTAAINKAIAVITATGTAGTVLIGAWLVRNGRISPGDLLIFVAYVGSLYKPVRDLGRLSGRFSRAAI